MGYRKDNNPLGFEINGKPYIVCECCTNEIPKEDGGTCADCGMAGLCPECINHNIHKDMLDDGK